jgi:hypothetical protein
MEQIMKHLIYFSILIMTLSLSLSAQHREVTAANARFLYPSTLSPKDFFPRQGFALQSEIPLYNTKQAAFFAGGSIDTYLSYFDLTIGGSLKDKDVLFRIEYGMNILYLINNPTNKMCISLGASAIIGVHAEDWKTSFYEWYFKAPSFVVGLKHHFDRYSITVGWKQDYAIFEKFKDGKQVSQEHLKRGALFLKFCVY